MSARNPPRRFLSTCLLAAFLVLVSWSPASGQGGNGPICDDFPDWELQVGAPIFHDPGCDLAVNIPPGEGAEVWVGHGLRPSSGVFYRIRLNLTLLNMAPGEALRVLDMRDTAGSRVLALFVKRPDPSFRLSVNWSSDDRAGTVDSAALEPREWVDVEIAWHRSSVSDPWGGAIRIYANEKPVAEVEGLLYLLKMPDIVRFGVLPPVGPNTWGEIRLRPESYTLKYFSE